MSSRRSMKKGKVLVVDDEPNVRLTLKEALEPLGYEIVLAGAGEEAKELADDSGVELVLLDLKMPGIDGLQVLEYLEQERPGLKVIIITAHGTVDSAVSSMRHGALDVIQKPFSLEQIRGLVREQMDTERRAQSIGSDHETHVSTARKLIGERRLDAAREHLASAVSEDESRPEAHNLLGVVAYALSDRLEGRDNDALRSRSTPPSDPRSII